VTIFTGGAVSGGVGVGASMGTPVGTGEGASGVGDGVSGVDGTSGVSQLVPLYLASQEVHVKAPVVPQAVPPLMQ